MKRPSNRQILTWLVLAAAAGLAFYKIKLAAVNVIAHQVAKGEIIAEVMGTGTLEARVKTTISARIQERLLEVLADQGDMVKKDQLLARLDDAESKQQCAIAEATLAAAKQTAERVGADLARSEAVLTQARRDEKRLAALLATSAVSQSDADKAGEALHVAEADLKRSNATIAEAQAQVLMAEKNLLFRQEQLAFTEVHSPYDGLIIRRDRDPGEVLVPGASLMQIISLGEIWVSAWVDETAMPALATGQPARIVFRSEPGRSYPGTVSRLGRETDRETREFLVDVRVTEMPKNWTIGQRAEVFIETGRQGDVVLLPSAFLARKQDRAGVFVNQNDCAHWQEITLGLTGSGQVAVTQGLDAGVTVIHAPERQKTPLAEGQRIALP
ncbi:efflux RND transporter periplasmic adaptor subunit [Prosthecobacter sp.]|uniref:efflux RND transporter periplasmic adaptor subunit n=1 Tax=Prosthecobacter sp. TaxID=1965333 RepID=UPI0024889C6B|nr:efflux RND transporter periplasmic adaptor subunit [Prosthecobacter sp.]MDI1311777.1 efflux RND transporter periplasmic adaptor subunit [Prosthecobacter sp.]